MVILEAFLLNVNPVHTMDLKFIRELKRTIRMNLIEKSLKLLKKKREQMKTKGLIVQLLLHIEVYKTLNLMELEEIQELVL
jgi:hypothetical protein